MPGPSIAGSLVRRLFILTLSLRWVAFAAPTINVALQASFHSAPYLLELLLVTLPQQLAHAGTCN